jgi:hypothetical protein
MGVCGGSTEIDECGVCNGLGASTWYGMDDTACNYAPDANINDAASCSYPEDPDYDCLGNCAIEIDCMGICGGSAPVDACDICNGPGASTWYGDSDGDGLGDPDVEDMSCYSPDGFVPNDDDEYPDCGANYYDCAGECGGDSSLSGCDNVCGSTAEYDDCGTCDNDPSNDCLCDYFDNCGVCNGDNSQCWYIDINTKILSAGEGSDFSIDLGWDNQSRLGMHIAADDGYNEYDVPGFDCADCYQDELDGPVSFPDGNFDFYFPHPEWEDDIDPIFGTTDIRKDIRDLERFDLTDCNDSTAFLVNGSLYFKHQVWDVNIDSDIDIPVSEENVELEFNFTNEFLNPNFTKAFLLMQIASGDTIVEIQNGDIFLIEDYDSPTGLKIYHHFVFLLLCRLRQFALEEMLW